MNKKNAKYKKLVISSTFSLHFLKTRPFCEIGEHGNKLNERAINLKIEGDSEQKCKSKLKMQKVLKDNFDESDLPKKNMHDI